MLLGSDRDRTAAKFDVADTGGRQKGTNGDFEIRLSSERICSEEIQCVSMLFYLCMLQRHDAKFYSRLSCSSMHGFSVIFRC